MVAVSEVAGSAVSNGKHWELTSYRWNGRTGVGTFDYRHRYSGRRVTVERVQPRYCTGTEIRC